MGTKPKKIKLPPKLNLRKELDILWAKIVKIKAGNKSELSGKTENLHAHHVFGKPNFRLRYELDNGICLTAGEHFYIAHVQGRAAKIDAVYRQRVGAKRYHEVLAMGNGTYKTPLLAVKLLLEQEYNKLKEIK